MRRALAELCLILLGIIGIHSVRIMQSGYIKGKLYPAGPGNSIVAINGTDSVKVESRNGDFGMRVTPGVWKVVVGVKERTGNVIRENLEVNQGENINLGIIRLSE
jgi:hypothetical protein